MAHEKQLPEEEGPCNSDTMGICDWSGETVWGVPKGFARRSVGVGYGIRIMLREEPFLRWVFS